MSLREQIRTANNNHSIKEAVIAVFLVNPIIKPERFQKLIEGDFANEFHQFETLNQVNVQFKNEIGKQPDFIKELRTNVGFKFSKFNKGKNEKVLQGLNEINRTFISYHSLDYTRWVNFLNEFIHIVKTISNYHRELFVSALSIHYIDEFEWIGKDELDLRTIFNGDGEYLPNEFFNSKVSNYSLVTEKISDGRKYLDRLEIVVESQITHTIRVSHNVTLPLEDVIDLANLINEDFFLDILNKGHLHNKEILHDILRPAIKELINLTPNP